MKQVKKKNVVFHFLLSFKRNFTNGKEQYNFGKFFNKARLLIRRIRFHMFCKIAVLEFSERLPRNFDGISMEQIVSAEVSADIFR